MKHFLFSLLVLTFTNILFAQTSLEPLKLNKSVLVHSAGVPEEFLLFVPDSAVQILFNPARANNFNSNFVYVNYLSDYTEPYYGYGYVLSSSDFYSVSVISPGSLNPLGKGAINNFASLSEENYNNTKNPTFSFAALINDADIKWLLQFTNGIFIDDVKLNSTSLTERNFSSINEYNTSINSTHRTLDQNLTTLKLSRIWNSGKQNYSLGVIGILYSDNYQSNGRYFQSYQRYFNNSPGARSSSSFSGNEIFEDQKRDEKGFAAGIEFGNNNELMDYVGSIIFEKRNLPERLNTFQSRTSIDSVAVDIFPPWRVTSFEEITEIDATFESSPAVISLNNYFQHSVNWITPDDNVFITLDGYYSFGDKTYNRLFVNRYTSNQTVITDSTISKSSGEFKSKVWGLNISTGYSLSLKFSDLYLLSGLKLHGFYRNSKDVKPSSSYRSSEFYESSVEISSAALTLPLYINYSPAKWVSIFGGLNYNYYYMSLESSDSSSGLGYSTSEFTIRDAVHVDNLSGWQSTKSIYAGCELRHDSGFKIQFFFKNNFAVIRDWNVSAGYHF